MSMPDPDFIDLRDIAGILRRQVRLILLTVFIGLGAAALYLFNATPLFTATTLVLVDPSQKNILNSQDSYSVPGSSENARLESEVEILKSDTVAMATVRAADLVSDPEFGPRLGLTSKIRTALGLTASEMPSGEELLSQTMRRLQSGTSIRRRGLTYVIAVSFTSESPANAARIANALSQTYIDLQIQTKVTAALGSRDLLLAQLDGARTAMVQSDDDLSGYIDDNINRLAEESGSEDVAALRNRLLDANARLSDTSSRLSAATSALAGNDWSALAQSLGDQAITALEAQRLELQRQLGQVESGTQEDIDLRAGLADLELQLKSRAQQSLSTLQGQVSTLDQTTSSVRDEIRRTVLNGNLPSATLAEIFSLQQEADIAQRQYQTLLSRQRELETQALVQVADSRIVSEALPPQSASFPKRKQILALALVAALAVGVGLALLNEYYLGGITSGPQLAHLVPARLGTIIPRVDQKSDQLSVADNVVEAPLSVYAEAIRRLRAAIDQSSAIPEDGRGRVIVIVSSIPAEGKSSLALALARTYAAAGKRTLMIDADLRKPALHRYLGLTPEKGFLDYLRDPVGVGEIESFYEVDPKTEAGAIMGHGRANVPTDQLLQSAPFETIIDNARAALDVTVIDTPPLIPVVDGRYIMAHADAVVLAVRYGLTSQSDLREAYAQIVDSVRPGTAILTVLTHDEGKIHSYRYSGYYADYTTD